MFTQLLFPGAAPDDDTGTPLRDGAFILNNMIARLAAAPWRFPVQAIITTPPVAPTHQQRWLIGPGASGAFAGKTHAIAEWVGTPDGGTPIAQWHFEAPSLGAFVYCASLDALLRWNGTAWISFAVAGPPGPQGIPGPQGPKGDPGGSSGGGSLTVAKDGVAVVAAASTLNFTGAGVTVTGTTPTAVITIGGGGTPTDPTDTGTLPSNQSWYALTFGAGKFLASGFFSDAAATSPDGKTWAGQTLPDTVILTKGVAAFGGGTFLIASGQTTVLTSTDVLTWTPRSVPSGQWADATYANGRFVLVGLNQTVAVSTDQGLTWTPATLPAGFDTSHRILCADGLFYAFSNISAATSPDGLTWTEIAAPFQAGQRPLVHDGARFVRRNSLGGTVETSVDQGASWQALTAPSGLGSRLSAGPGQTLFWEPNSAQVHILQGSSFTPKPLASAANWTAGGFGGGRFVLIGQGSTSAIIPQL